MNVPKTTKMCTNQNCGTVLCNAPELPNLYFFLPSSLDLSAHPESPLRLLLPGTYSGAILLWDTRQKAGCLVMPVIHWVSRLSTRFRFSH